MFKFHAGLSIVLKILIFSVSLTTSCIIFASSLPTIIISPEWRDVDQQSVSSTVNVLSDEQLDDAGVINTQDLQHKIPGVVFSTSSGVAEPHLRGVGGTVSVSGGSGVSTFIDGVYLTRSNQALQELFDVKRVEVIKGPHGVHLGRNVVGGAVSIITQDPLPYHEAYLDVLYGSYDQHQLRGAVNVPFSETNLSLRLAGTISKRDGYAENIFREDNMDDQDYYAWRGKLRYRPSNNLDVIFSAEQDRQDDVNGLGSKVNPDVGTNGGILTGGVVPDDPRKVANNVDQNIDDHNDFYSTKIIWNSNNIEFKSLTAYQKTTSEHAIDLDGTDSNFSSNSPSGNTRTLSQEFRLASKRELQLSWVAGIYLFDDDAINNFDVEFPLMAIQSLADSTIESMSYSLFGELNYLFTSKWQGRIGLRYNYDEVRLDLQQTLIDPLGLQGPAGTTTVSVNDSEQWNALIPEFGLSYIADADSLYYGKISRGYKSGGFNSFSIQPAYDPEYLWSYELGIKKSVPTRQLRVNASVFYYDYSDIQLLTLPPNSPAGTLPIITNAAEATIQGLDLQLWYRPLANIELTAGATLLDSYFDDFVSVDPNNPAVDPDRSGDPLPYAPDVSLVLGGQYRWLQFDHGDLSLSAYYKYQSLVYFNPYHDEAVKQGAYGLVDASLRYASFDSHWYAELYGKNITDELYAQNIVRVDPIVGTKQFWGPPRTFGVRVGYTF